MKEPWEPERAVDPELAQALIRAQMPGIAVEEIEWLGAGWDNVVYRVDTDWVFRFPQRQLGADLLATELRVMPIVAPRLPLPVAKPVHFGEPTAEYPWPFAGYRFLRGKTACRAALGEEQRLAMAAPLARFTRALHDIPLEALAGTGLPEDELGRMDAEARKPRTRELLEDLVSRGVIDAPDRWLPIFEVDKKLGTPCLVHGDLYVRHLVVDGAGGLKGVIDWGDVHYGDPSCDLMIAFCFLPRAARDRFFEVYGPIDEAARRRARFRALFHTAAITHFGQETGDEQLFQEGRAGLERLADEMR